MKTGDFIYRKRMHRCMTLREFCRLTEFDAANWSKVERGILPPPKSKEINELFDFAMLDSIAPELKPKNDILKMLPLFIRNSRGEKLDEYDLRELLKFITAKL